MSKGLLARANEMTTASENSNLLANWLQGASSRQPKKEVLAATTAGALDMQQRQLEAGYEALQLEMNVQKQVAKDKLLLDHRHRMDELVNPTLSSKYASWICYPRRACQCM